MTSSATVSTVSGELHSDQLGSVLMHEHIFILTPELDQDYAEIVGWDEERRVESAVRQLRAARQLGVDTIVDLTVLGMGRNVRRVRRVAEAAGVNIVVASGIYLVDLPVFVRNVAPNGVLPTSVDPLVDMFVRDVRSGIGDSGIRAAIYKCATGEAGVTEDVERALRAVAIAHRETGAPISTHTHARSKVGTDQLDIFQQEGVDLAKVVVGHSGDTDDVDYLRSLADRGATLGMDRFGMYGGRFGTLDDRVGIVARMCELGYSRHLVLSHDASTWTDWVPQERTPGTEFDMPEWNFSHIHSRVLSALSGAGVTDEQIRHMLVDNPRRILTAATKDA